MSRAEDEKITFAVRWLRKPNPEQSWHKNDRTMAHVGMLVRKVKREVFLHELTKQFPKCFKRIAELEAYVCPV